MATNLDSISQPIIRGIQAVGTVQVLYRYNTSDGHLPIPSALRLSNSKDLTYIDTQTGFGIPVSGFRLDSEFLRANPQIASSFVIPILGGGGVALTNNNRTGTLNLVCTKISTPAYFDSASNDHKPDAQHLGSMYTPAGAAIGVEGGNNDSRPFFDMVTLAQVQQAQDGGDSVGATITIKFKFCGLVTTLKFKGCTIATVDPIGLAGNDAVNYAIAVNYLSWDADYVSQS